MNIHLPQERWGPAQRKAVSTSENEICRQWTLHFLFSWHIPPESVQHTLAKSLSSRCLPPQPKVCRQGAWRPWPRPHWTWLDLQLRFYHAKWDLVVATPKSNDEPRRERCAPRTVPRTTNAARLSDKMSERWSQSISSKRLEETVCGASDVPCPWPACNS